MCSYSDDYEFKVEWLQTNWKKGRDVTRAILKELREKGYLKTTPSKTTGGIFDGYEWFISNTPIFSTSDGPPENPSSGETGLRSDGPPVIQECIKKEVPFKKEENLSKKGEKEIATEGEPHFFSGEYRLTDWKEYDPEKVLDYDAWLGWLEKTRKVNKLNRPQDWCRVLNHFYENGKDFPDLTGCYLWLDSLDWTSGVNPGLMMSQLESYVGACPDGFHSKGSDPGPLPDEEISPETIKCENIDFLHAVLGQVFDEDVKPLSWLPPKKPEELGRYAYKHASELTEEELRNEFYGYFGGNELNEFVSAYFEEKDRPGTGPVPV